MQETVVLSDAHYVERIVIVFILSFVLLALVSNVIGKERKSQWFKKRTKYTIFTRRSILGEFIHYGRPCTWQGCVVFIGLFTVILTFGYWYVFCY